LVLRTALLFIRRAVRLVYAELPEPVAVCSPKQALCELAGATATLSGFLATSASQLPGGTKLIGAWVLTEEGL
jgi:hypothetical protein